MLNRAYSLLEIKSMDEDKRTIEGIATTPTADRMGDVVEPKGAEFKLPVPLLWQHKSNEPIGHVTWARITDKGIQIRATLAKVDEPGRLKDRLDEAWQSIKSGLVGGLSIGFQAIESAKIEGSYSYRFTKWMWLELSAVTIPANGEASITAIKSIDQELRAATGHEEADRDRGETSPGASGTTKARHRVVSTRTTETKTMDIAEQIASFEEARKVKSDRMDAIMEASASKGETLDAEQTEEYDGLDQEVQAIDAHLKRLKAAEQRKAASAKPVGDGGRTQIETKTGSEARIPATVRAPKQLDKGIEFARFAICVAAARGSHVQALEIAKARYSDSEDIITSLKAAVAGGTTTDATWAGNLVDTYQRFTLPRS